MGSRKFFLVAGVVAGAVALSFYSIPTAGAVSVGHSSWSWGNPLPQGNAIKGLEFIGTRGYAAGDFGTLLRTDDAGATWTGIATGITQGLARIRIIDSDSVVIAGGCAVRRSDDAGQSFNRLPWTASDLNCPEAVVSLSFPTEQVGYLLIANGNVFRTADGGRTWSRKTAVPGTRATGGDAAPTDVAFINADTGVATTSAGRIYRTTDAGGSWTLVRVHDHSLFGLTFVDANIGYAVGDASSVLKTTDGGMNWTQKTGGTLRITSIRCADERTCLATVDAGDRVLRTTDGAGNFTSVTPSTDKIIAAAFVSTTRAVAAGEFGVTVTSSDAGATWATTGGRIAEELTRLRAQSTSLGFAAGKAGALARTTDGGATWTSLGVSTSADVVDVSFPTAQTGFALDSGGQLLRTDNSGESWQILDTGTARAPLAVLALDANQVLLVGPRGIRRSTNGGGQFNPVRGRRAARAVLFDYDRANVRCVFAHGARQLIYSTNAGGSWKRARLPERPIIDADFSSCNRGFVLSREGRVYQTRNRGRRWKELLGLGAFVSEISFSSSTRGYALVNSFGGVAGTFALRTYDGGKSWQPELVHHEEIKGERPLASVFDAASGRDTALLIAGQNSLFTTRGAEAGQPSTLRLKTRRRRVRRGRTIELTGSLTPAEGGERVLVSRRAVRSAVWSQRFETVASNGQFTTRWRVTRPSVFLAQWVGDDDRAGDASNPLAVSLRRPR